jgi:DNA invertase Pin-like site-specific DNA recombinase
VPSKKIVAYSYVRFSSDKQAEGDSLRRQTELAEAYCKRRGWRLDDTLTLRDLGVSAFRGDNAFNGNLRNFLNAIDRETVRPGSALIVESIDRISRQGIDEGYDTIKKILKAGVTLITLAPEREFGVEAVKSLSKGALEIMLILERAAEESERKAERVHAAWVGRRRLAAEKGVLLTRRLPAWVEERGGRLVLIPPKAQVVRRIFDLAIAGYGAMRIVKKLAAEGVPPLANSKEWYRSLVSSVLADRRAVGEYQPRNRLRQPDGEVIPNYYPPVVTEDEYALARSGARKRRHRPGRTGSHVNLFSCLIREARHGDTYVAKTRTWRGRSYRVLDTHGGMSGLRASYSFPLQPLEEAFLSLLREIDPHDILNGDARPDESVALAAELARIELRIADLEKELLQGDVAAGVRALRVLEAQKSDLAEQLSDARQRAAHPLSETWGEAKGLLEALASDECRTRLRAALRALIAEAWLLVVPLPNHDRCAALQFYFNTDDPAKQRRRDYLVYYRHARNNGTPSSWWAKSLAAVASPGDLDLRKPDHAARLEKVLLALDLDNLSE